MGLARTIAIAAVLALTMGAGTSGLSGMALAAEDQGVAVQGRVIPLPLPVRSGAMTEVEASQMLRSEGYEVVESGRTLLGRIRIVADGPLGRREIVLHPGDGRVLRDIVTEAPPSAAVSGTVVEVAPVVPQSPTAAADPAASATAPQSPATANPAAPGEAPAAPTSDAPAPAASAPVAPTPVAPTPVAPAPVAPALPQAAATEAVDPGVVGPEPAAAAQADPATEGAGL